MVCVPEPGDNSVCALSAKSTYSSSFCLNEDAAVLVFKKTDKNCCINGFLSLSLFPSPPHLSWWFYFLSNAILSKEKINIYVLASFIYFSSPLQGALSGSKDRNANQTHLERGRKFLSKQDTELAYRVLMRPGILAAGQCPKTFKLLPRDSWNLNWKESFGPREKQPPVGCSGYPQPLPRLLLKTHEAS